MYSTTTANASADKHQRDVISLADWVGSTANQANAMLFMGTDTPHALLGRQGLQATPAYASSNQSYGNAGSSSYM